MRVTNPQGLILDYPIPGKPLSVILPILSITMDNLRLIEKIVTSARSYPNVTFDSRGCAYTCVNPFSYSLVRRNYDELYDRLDGVFVDGLFMCMMIRLLWGEKVPRHSFDMAGMAVDLFERLNASGSAESVFFIGARQEALERSVRHILHSYPSIRLAGFRNGYFKDEEERREAIRQIVESGADFAIIGMGAPMQERFALDLRDAGFKGTSFTCGGFLHQTSNGINYYPHWVNRFNLRAFYRLLHEKGMFARLYNVLLEFPVLFVRDSVPSRLRKR